MTRFYQVIIDGFPHIWSGDERCSWTDKREVFSVLSDLNHVNPRTIRVWETTFEPLTVGAPAGPRTADVTFDMAEDLADFTLENNTASADTWPPSFFPQFAYSHAVDYCDDQLAAVSARIAAE